MVSTIQDASASLLVLITLFFFCFFLDIGKSCNRRFGVLTGHAECARLSLSLSLTPSPLHVGAARMDNTWEDYMARKTGSLNHTHKYFRRYDGLWACAGIDGCTHYMPKNMAPAPVGLNTICWGGCGRAFMLTPYAMENEKPMCDDCQAGLDALNEVTESMMRDAPKPTGLAAFGARSSAAVIPIVKTPPVKTMADLEKDEIEVIEDEGGHAPDCGVYDGEVCSCK